MLPLMQYTRFVGIDPGQSGALVILNPAMGIEECLVMPDKLTLRKIAKSLSDAFVTIEDPGCSDQWSAASAMKFGHSVGFLEGLFEKPLMVHPGTWQSQVWMKGSAQKGAKAKSLEIAQMIWPMVDWRLSSKHRVAHDGLVDAALIAYYGLKNKHLKGAHHEI